MGMMDYRLEGLEENDLEYVNDLSREIGVLQRVAETFPKKTEIQQLCQFHISANQGEIENTMENFYDRRKESRITQDISG